MPICDNEFDLKRPIDSRHFPLHCGPCGWANDAAGRFLATESAKLLNKSIPFDDAENFLYELSTNQRRFVGLGISNRSSSLKPFINYLRLTFEHGQKRTYMNVEATHIARARIIL